METRQQLIERLTGVRSSKQNYYTKLKKTVLQLQKKNMQLEIINDVMKSFNVEMLMDDMLKNILEKLTQIFRFNRLSLSMLKGNELVLTNVFPESSLFLKKGTHFPRENSRYWEVVQTKKALYWDIQNEREVKYFEQEPLICLNMKSVLLFPLISKEKVIGLLSIGSEVVASYDEADWSFFQQLSDQLAVCLENSRLFNAVLSSKKEWEETFRAVSDQIVFLDCEQNIVRVNDSVKTFFNIDERKLIGKKFHELYFPEQVDKENNPVLESLITEKTAYRQFHLEQRLFECHSYPVLNEKKAMYAFIVYIKDVTEKRRIEGQLIQSGKLAAIGEMAAGVAHELNNPLTAILGNAQLLLRKNAGDSSEYKLLHDIFHCGKRCKSIIQNLLTFSRQDEYTLQECSVNEAVEQVLSLIGDQIKKQQITIVEKRATTLPKVDGNIQQIGQVILNLILNAKDALEECGRKKKQITIETSVIWQEEQAWIQLSVSDNGIGMSEAQLMEVFNPFFTTKEAMKGTGLGLSVSIGIAEAHGGTLEAMSTLGKGSTFVLRLPVKNG